MTAAISLLQVVFTGRDLLLQLVTLDGDGFGRALGLDGNNASTDNFLGERDALFCSDEPGSRDDECGNSHEPTLPLTSEGVHDSLGLALVHARRLQPFDRCVCVEHEGYSTRRSCDDWIREGEGESNNTPFGVE